MTITKYDSLSHINARAGGLPGWVIAYYSPVRVGTGLDNVRLGNDTNQPGLGAEYVRSGCIDSVQCNCNLLACTSSVVGDRPDRVLTGSPGWVGVPNSEHNSHNGGSGLQMAVFSRSIDVEWFWGVPNLAVFQYPLAIMRPRVSVESAWLGLGSH